MQKSPKVILGTAFLAVLAVLVPTQATQAAPAGEPNVTHDQIAAMSQSEQAKLLDPLRALANAVDALGRPGSSGAYTGIYAGIELDAPAKKVNIYLTDVKQSAKLLADAKRADKSIDTRLANIKQGKHSRQDMHAARDRAFRSGQGLGIASISVPVDGSALVIGVSDVAAAQQALTRPVAPGRTLAAEVGVETVFKQAAAGSDMSRRMDSVPWIAGAALGNTSLPQSSGWLCTSGVPTRRKSDGKAFLITAAHCFADGNSVWTGWENGRRNYIGQVVARANLWDAVAVDTTNTGLTRGMAWDGPNNGDAFVQQLTSSAYSYNGDYVCQDGFTSGVICSIRVVDQDISWTGSNGVPHRGVEGSRSGTAIRGGDSGGLVFGITGSTRQARGINSWGGGGTIRWTEVVDIYNTWNLALAP
ncbi:S1 family peptidase [Yinghuangia soli]|uniref:S1 family peptidase n=1 Tax=Yinghuangia soli TaxID=2908204 RepID=A0AA41TZS2_9ACTN|nr:S1 family peptidase [Yinghuangia soli]MCF2527806.1 S1 family peptidase [Yinghuangia soli]